MTRLRAEHRTEAPGLLGTLWAEIRAPQDPFFVDAGRSGELLVARIRLFLMCVLLLIQFLPGADPLSQRVGLSLNLVSLAWAVIVYVVVAYQYRPWMGFASGAIDVTLVSACLVVFCLVDRPHTAVNSKVFFEVYFLALGCASLRYDWRVCATTGLLALGQYAGIVVYADWRWSLNDPSYAPYVYGMFSWNVQAARLILLGAASVLSVVVVLRAHRLRRLSTTDRLTGLHNRGVFDERLLEEVSRARRHDRPFVVAVIDIDHFKRFNDTHGHAGGDAALRTVADALRRSVRASDVVARIGGEEFGLVLSETSTSEALKKLESIRTDVAALPLAVGPNGVASRVTISIGVAAFPEDGGEVTDVLAFADSRLYEAKRGGRDRVVGPQPLSSPALSSARA